MRLIDADALKEVTTKRNSIWNKITDSNGRGLEEIIDAVPTVFPEDAKGGKWNTGYNFITCSVCGMDAPSDNYSNPMLTMYCPFCGAKMKNGNPNAKTVSD